MKWTRFALKLPTIISGVTALVEHFALPGKDKETKVLEALPTAVALTEYSIGRDLLNDPEVLAAAKAFIAAEVALKNIITKKSAPEGVILPPPPVSPF